MLIKFICWLFGHKILHKVFTGKQYDAVDLMTGNPIKGNYYIWRRSPFCLRCGKEIHTNE